MFGKLFRSTEEKANKAIDDVKVDAQTLVCKTNETLKNIDSAANDVKSLIKDFKKKTEKIAAVGIAAISFCVFVNTIMFCKIMRG